MRIEVRGDSSEWRLLQKRLAKLAGGMAEHVYKPVGEAGRSLVLRGIRAGTDPYGAPHPAPLLRAGLPLNDTGLLRRSVSMTYGRSGAAIIVGARYAGYLQGGTGLYGPRRQRIKPVRAKMLAWKSGGQRYVASSVRGIKPRRIVPDTGRASPRWDSKLRTAALTAMRKALGR